MFRNPHLATAAPLMSWATSNRRQGAFGVGLNGEHRGWAPATAKARTRIAGVLPRVGGRLAPWRGATDVS